MKGGKAKAKKKVIPKRGRPTIYTPSLASLICSLLAEGQSLRKICALESMPHISTVLAWIFTPSEHQSSFSEQYRRARQMQAEIQADELIDIADDSSEDELFSDVDEESGKSAKRTLNKEFVQRSKLRVETRQWIASRLLPKVYGAKPEEKIEHTDDSAELTALAQAMASTYASPDNGKATQ